MKQTKKVLALLLVLVLSLGVFAACDTSGQTAEEPAKSAAEQPKEESKPEEVETEEPKEEVTVHFWTHYSDDIGFTEKKVADYNEMMAGKVNIELKHVADDYNNILLLSLKNDDGPDLFANGVELPQLVSQGYLAPLDDYISDDMLARAESFKQEDRNFMDGHWYSLPFRGYNFRLAWNKDMFEAAGLDPEKPPTTYAEVLEMSEALSEYGQQQNPQQYPFMLPTGEDWIWWIYGDQMARRNGDNNFDFVNVEYDFNYLRPVMEFYLEMKEKNYLFPGGTSMLNDPARAQFSGGNVGMILAASWDIGVFNDQFPAEIEWDVAPLPNIDGELHGYTQFDAGSYLHINAQSEVKQEAMDFHEYLLSEETLIEYYENGYGIPVYEGISEKASVQPDRPGFVGFSNVEIDHVYPLEPQVQIEGKGHGELMNDVMNGAADLDATLEDLTKRYNEALQKAIDSGEIDREKYHIEDFSTLNPLGE